MALRRGRAGRRVKGTLYDVFTILDDGKESFLLESCLALT